ATKRNVGSRWEWPASRLVEQQRAVAHGVDVRVAGHALKLIYLHAPACARGQPRRLQQLWRAHAACPDERTGREPLTALDLNAPRLDLHDPRAQAQIDAHPTQRVGDRLAGLLRPAGQHHRPSIEQYDLWFWQAIVIHFARDPPGSLPLLRHQLGHRAGDLDAGGAGTGDQHAHALAQLFQIRSLLLTL